MSVSEAKKIVENAAPMDIDSDETESTNLTSLDDLCLEHVFGYLSAVDLLNVADTTKQVHDAALVVFKRKYCTGKVIIGGGYDYKTRDASDTSSMPSNQQQAPSQQTQSNSKLGLLIVHPLHTLKLLRNFGHLIWGLEMSFRFFGPKLSIKMEQYLFRYCSNSLELLSFDSHEKLFYESHENTFTKLNILRVEMCRIGSHAKLHTYFPKMQNLYLGVNYLDDRTFIGFNFACLRTLTIHAEHFGKEHIRAALKSNPQLDNLTVTTNSVRLLHRINKYTRLIQLKLNSVAEDVIAAIPSPIHFETVETFHLHNYRPLDKFPFSFGNLKFLFIRGWLVLNRKTLNSIGSMQQLTSLFIVKVDNLDSVDALFQLENIRSNVEELCIGEFDNTVPVDCILRFLVGSTALKRLNVVMTSKNDEVIDKLKAKLNDKWKLINRKFGHDFTIQKVEG